MNIANERSHGIPYPSYVLPDAYSIPTPTTASLVVTLLAVPPPPCLSHPHHCQSVKLPYVNVHSEFLVHK